MVTGEEEVDAAGSAGCCPIAEAAENDVRQASRTAALDLHRTLILDWKKDIGINGRACGITGQFSPAPLQV
jgi:hypothetical protein